MSALENEERDGDERHGHSAGMVYIVGKFHSILRVL